MKIDMECYATLHDQCKLDRGNQVTELAQLCMDPDSMNKMNHLFENKSRVLLTSKLLVAFSEEEDLEEEETFNKEVYVKVGPFMEHVGHGYVQAYVRKGESAVLYQADLESTLALVAGLPITSSTRELWLTGGKDYFSKSGVKKAFGSREWLGGTAVLSLFGFQPEPSTWEAIATVRLELELNNIAVPVAFVNTCHVTTLRIRDGVSLIGTEMVANNPIKLVFEAMYLKGTSFQADEFTVPFFGNWKDLGVTCPAIHMASVSSLRSIIGVAKGSRWSSFAITFRDGKDLMMCESGVIAGWHLELIEHRPKTLLFQPHVAPWGTPALQPIDSNGIARAIGALEANLVDLLKDSMSDLLKESMPNLLKESMPNLLKESMPNLLKESMSDLLKESMSMNNIIMASMNNIMVELQELKAKQERARFRNIFACCKKNRAQLDTSA
ncbi:hypothetical protein MPSEU_000025000 [Mayamaea pseudoterrestris]|nr:hypothetical protein MPSEU_000025000 [Mayamaea pseudoterrestris]